MGILERISTKGRFSLAPQSLVGRSSQCILRIEDPRVSGMHVMLRWRREGWEARDLASSNGTVIDGKKVVSNVWVPLREGSELRFAGGDAWVLVSAQPPLTNATSESGEARVAEHGLLVLPDWTAPVACVYEDADGMWWIEVGDEARVATDQETIVAGGPWVLSIPPMPNVSDSTTLRLDRTLALEIVTLRFRHSVDQEYVDMCVVTEDGATPPFARAYLHVLLTLARVRLDDRAMGLPPQEQGWTYVETLRSMLQMDPERVNVDIYRARKELAQLGLIDASAIVERRTSTRQVRLGTDRVEILPYDKK